MTSLELLSSALAPHTITEVDGAYYANGQYFGMGFGGFHLSDLWQALTGRTSYSRAVLNYMAEEAAPVGSKVVAFYAGEPTEYTVKEYGNRYALLLGQFGLSDFSRYDILNVIAYAANHLDRYDEIYSWPVCAHCGLPIAPNEERSSTDNYIFHTRCSFYCEYHKRLEPMGEQYTTTIYGLDDKPIGAHCFDVRCHYEILTGRYYVHEAVTELESGDWVLTSRIDELPTCEECGAIIAPGRNLCYRCREARDKYIDIHDYSYKPEPKFRGDATNSIIPGYLGVELEVDNGGEDDDIATEVNDFIGYTYCKHDGSLNEGFEIVSDPATLEFHMSSKSGWEAASRYLLDKDYSSHYAKTCGLHVHVSRDAFGETFDEQEAAIARLVFLFEKHWDKLVKFSRRTEGQLLEWAWKYDRVKGESITKLYEKAKGTYSRYRAINLTNTNTVEFRMWRGTLNIETFMATLQLVALLVKYVTTHTTQQTALSSWKAITKSDFAELNAYLEARELN